MAVGAIIFVAIHMRFIDKFKLLYFITMYVDNMQIICNHVCVYSNVHRGGSRLLKRGTARFVIIVDSGLVGICTLIVCKACYANTREVWGHAPRKFWKITPSEIESEGIFSNFSLFDVSVDTGTQN